VSRQPLTTYIPSGYESHGAAPSISATHPGAPPIPVPLSTLSFPLDPIRTYLLGQLEYYLSPQNMAQDFFLRQRVSANVNIYHSTELSLILLNRWIHRDGFRYRSSLLSIE
jgi:hypothetical protein